MTLPAGVLVERLAVAVRLHLIDVPVDVWTAPADLRTSYGRPLADDDLHVILTSLHCAGLPATALLRA